MPFAFHGPDNVQSLKEVESYKTSKLNFLFAMHFIFDGNISVFSCMYHLVLTSGSINMYSYPLYELNLFWLKAIDFIFSCFCRWG